MNPLAQMVIATLNKRKALTCAITPTALAPPPAWAVLCWVENGNLVLDFKGGRVTIPAIHISRAIPLLKEPRNAKHHG